MHIQRFDTNARLSRVVVHGDTAYFSGLTADDRSKDAEGQTAEILAKADSYLETLGVTRNAVLAATIWLRDIGDFDLMNAAWTAWIDAPPARATVEAVLGLPDIRVEIQFTVAIA
ncbi:RidA family protein [Martelella sp. FOR1707]